MYNFSFEYPYLFLLLIPFLFCFIYCKAKESSYFMPHLNLLNESTKKSTLLINLLKYLTVILAITALASPVKIKNTQFINSDGIDIVLNLDTSDSMKQRGFNKFDLQENRFDVVKELASDFIDKRINDNIALVVFGNSSLIASTLSFDKQAQKEILNYLDIGIVGPRTALIDSLASSVKILKNSKSKSKIIILLSDGEDTSSQIPFNIVLKLLKKYNIKVYTIAIQSQNRYILNKIAKETNGKYFNANSKEDLQNVYKQINELEKSKLKKNKVVLKEYYYFYPLFIATIILILLIYLKNKE
ncbi:VWA domain-containing protein [Malaciobacter canalis]|jgi:Ca-activated chloride channel family protein|uniref:VWA domain-containing protein n=1 Tax=Malaciobacter canalis TaxID=1912871 RepID=A0ABX4LNA3_9BACT|nr:VWA domain-containing protein [Malaciobacter canalis]PHO09357.1 VWA domain-containing protein [Malaciobacter canalis]QEE32169.1 von Willebrand factor type A (vWA) domain-containing protein (BatA domain), putative oxygen tolerance protein BatA [Malaciobacter canalis]